MDAVEEVKQRLNIEDVISEYVQLKRSGRNFKGLSPFSAEKTPSFVVSPEKQIWHDFSSGRGGSMFGFVMEMEGLDFKGALELLARKAGVDLEQYRGTRSGQTAKTKERLYEALELATKFYQVQFSKHKKALEYVLSTRKFSKQTALEWRLGYAPNTGTALVDFLTSKKFTDDEIKKAGLSAQRYRGLADMFRGRIMIPLCDPQGRVIGFTARLLEDAPNAPKYINTPQTMLYDKSRHVFGLHLAKETLRTTKIAVLVEGNLDVISSHQAGVRNVVATAGTALTEPHLKVLSRFTDDVRLSFDADKAGISATERAIPIASKVGVSLSIITIPSGKDPDELIKQSVDTWRHIIEQPQYALDWLMARYQKLLDIRSAQGKRQFSDVLLPIVNQLQDSVEQDHYLQEIARVLAISREALTTKLVRTGQGRSNARAVSPTKQPAAKPQEIDKTHLAYQRTQDNLLAVLLMHPPARQQVDLITEHMFITPQARQLFAFLSTHPSFSFDDALPAELNELSDYVKILALQYEEEYRTVDTLEFDIGVTRLQSSLIDKYVKAQKALIAKQQQNATDEQAEKLSLANDRLNQLLNKIKGGR